MSDIRYKNILLINPWSKDVFPPPSIGYLQGAIRHHFKDNVNVQACNLNNIDLALQSNRFDLVAVSFHSFSVKHAIEIRNKIKNARLICGGHHPSALPEQMLSIGYDQIVIGEGENAIIDIIYGKDDKIVKHSSDYFNSIDDIPIPDYSGLGEHWPIGYPIISSRGCPFTCNFCASASFWKRKWRARKVDNITELLFKIQTTHMKTWMFEDDNFTLNSSRAIEICNKIIENKINFEWQCASRAESLQNEKLVKALYDAGCRNVWLGVESFSQNSLDRCKKNTTVEKMVNGIKLAQKHGLNPICQIIIGLPGDTLEDIVETRKIIKQYNIPNIGPNIAWILPNTEIYMEAKKRGFDEAEYLINGAPFYTYEQSYETLIQWQSLITS